MVFKIKSHKCSNSDSFSFSSLIMCLAGKWGYLYNHPFPIVKLTTLAVEGFWGTPKNPSRKPRVSTELPQKGRQSFSASVL